VFRFSVINELERLKETELGTVTEFTWNDWGNVRGTFLIVEGI
jgi:YD repeat-containing protein